VLLPVILVQDAHHGVYIGEEGVGVHCSSTTRKRSTRCQHLEHPHSCKMACTLGKKGWEYTAAEQQARNACIISS
jgi:hypothetical protein